MKDRTFLITLCVTVLLCIAATATHVAYAADAYTRASIIQFVAGEVW